MNCPTCRNEMMNGTLALDAATGLFGAGLPGVFFVQEDQDQICILALGQARAAYCCNRCGTVIVCGRDGTESQSLACEEAMAPGITVCPKCDWTYKQ